MSAPGTFVVVGREQWPREVSVLGNTVLVEYDRDMDVAGEYHDDLTIKLDPEQRPSMVFRTLLHEMYHAAFRLTRHADSHKKVTEEDAALVGEMVMVSLLKDNQGLVDFMKDWL